MSAVIGSKCPESRCQGKIVQEEIDASKEKSCQKEETLTTSESESRESFIGLSEGQLSRGFLFQVLCRATDRARNAKGRSSGEAAHWSLYAYSHKRQP
jgi:hypothetical protein